MTLTPVKRFWQLLSLYRPELRQIYLFAVFNGIVNLTLPLGIQAIINFIQAGEPSASWFLLVGIVLVGIAANGIIQILQLRILEDVQQNLFARSAFEFAYRLPRIQFLSLDKVHGPELANRFFDTLTIQKGLPKIVIDFSLAAFQIVFGLLVLSVYSSYFIILAIVLVGLLYLLIQITGPKGLETSIKESKYKYRIAHWLEEIARNNRTFKLNLNSGYHMHRADHLVEGYLVNREKHFKVIINQYRLFIAFKVIVAAGLLFLGGYLVFAQQMNLGQFVAAEIIIILIIASAEKIMTIIESIYDVLTGLDKIGHVTDLPLDNCSGKSSLDDSHPVEIRALDLSFRFPDEQRNVIDDLDMHIKAGQKVVLDGRSGSGKTVLLHLLAGIHRPTDGELYFNDIPFTTFNRDQLYSKIGVAYPSTQIFEGSLRDNITLGREVSDRRLGEVLEILQLNNYLVHQANGLESFVDSGGRRLPRAVIQKVMIARIILTEPKLLLMEDPLIFVGDSEKHRIIDYLMSPDRPWTALVVSDDPYWVERADSIIDLTEETTHA